MYHKCKRCGIMMLKGNIVQLNSDGICQICVGAEKTKKLIERIKKKVSQMEAKGV